MRKLILLLLLPIFSFAQTRQSGGISFTPQWNYKIAAGDTTWQFGNTLINQFPYILTKWQSDQRYAPIAGGGYVPATRLISTGIGLLGGGNLGSNLTLYVDTANITSKTFFNTRIGTAIAASIATKEPSIIAGTTLQYWRGDKTFQTLNTAAVPELTNLYYTNARGIGSTLTGYSSGAGTVSASDNILQAIQKLNGNIAAISANAITALTGDAAATGPGSVALTLATVNSNTGSFGTASSVPTITFNGKGLATSAANTSIQIAESQVTSLVADLALKAPLASPILTGTPTTPTPGSNINTTQIVNGAWVNTYYQPSLVSGTNIKTVNNNTLLGSGNLAITPSNTDTTATGFTTRYSTNRFYGETWYVLGDSFVVQNIFQDYLTRRIGVTITSNGVNSTCVAMGCPVGNSFVERMPTAISAGKNRVMVATWDNDYYWGVTIGTIASTSDSTYYGALKHIAALAIAAGQKMIWVTGGQRGTDASIYTAQKAYNDAMLEVANLYGIPVVNSFDGSGLTYATNSIYTGDGVHLNSLGKPIFGNFLASSILSQASSVPSIGPSLLNTKILTSFSATSPLSYNNATGLFSMTAAGSGVSGYMNSSTQSISGQKTWLANQAITLSQNASTALTVNNTNSGTGAEARLQLFSNAGGAAMYATSSAYSTSALAGQAVFQNTGSMGWVWYNSGVLMKLSAGGALTLNTPATASGAFNLLTWNNSSGVVERTTALPSSTTAVTRPSNDFSNYVATTHYVDSGFFYKQNIITFGTGVQAALANNIGLSGAVVLNNGVLGTPSSGIITNLTGTCTSCNIGGSAASLSAASTLPSNTLATTPSAGDNSTKVSTTAYADAAAANTGVFNNPVYFSSSITANSIIVLKNYTVATLPASPSVGATAYVTDAAAPTYLTAVVGGGAVRCPVFYNGSAWVSH